MPSKDGKLRILSCCGGGIRGLMSATILRFVENYTGRPVHQLFDLVCGTSTGGLMALALTKPQPMCASDCSDLFLHYGPDIFERTYWRAAWTLNGNLAPKYDGEGLRGVLSQVFGSATLEQATVPTFVTSYDLARRLPALHCSWATSEHPRPLVDTALATSAAPTYFPPVNLLGALHVDGGVVCNNPSLSGVIEACKLAGAHTRDALVLSVGTGTCVSPLNSKRALHWGRLGWISPLIDTMLDGVPDLTHAQMLDLLPDGQYVHLDPSISAAHAALDNCDLQNLSELQAIGEKAVASQKAVLLPLLDRL